ncbi:Phytochrome-like protein cph1 [Anaerolineales bacterium]|nr:Phytochrome-like protein cph1 [Anaerolineales bacterium]
MSIYDGKGRPIFAIYAFIFLFLAMGIITGGNLSYRNFEREFRRQAEKQISSIAELKVNGLVNWRSERLLDAEFFYQNQAFSRLVEDYFENPDDAFSQAELIASMKRYQSYDQYDQVSLLDVDGKNRLVVSDNLTEPVPEYSSLKGDVTVCLDSGEIMLFDFRRDADTNGRVSISILVPIFAEQDQRPLGAFAIRVDPETYLYPYLNQWPVPSDTAETLLVRSADGDVLFLNQLRFRQDAALNLRIPLTSTGTPAVQAALGRNGVMEGLDYRGEPVLADVRPVPDSPWFLVSKVDMIEVYTPLRDRLWQTLLIVAMAIFISGLALFAVWRQQRVFYYRTKAETTEALRASEEKFRKAFLLSPDSININRLHDGMYVSINDGFTRITGYDSEEVIGKSSVEMNIWANPQDRKQLVDGLLKEGKVENLEFRFRMKNGGIRDGLMSASFFELDGTPHIISITRDITDVRLADQKMREAQLVLENSPVILFRWKAAAGWPVELVSENASQFGYTPEDFLSGTIPYASIIHPDDLERVVREVSKYSSSGVDHFQQEYRIVTRDGQVRWTDDRTMTERDAQGNVMYYQGTVMDITERKRTEEELRRQTALFRSLFERSPEAITIVDQEDRILNVNRSFEDLFGYQEAEIQGRYVNDLIVSGPYKDEAEGITRSALGEGQVVEKETVRCTKDGSLVDVSMVGYPIYVERQIIGGSGIYRDITERKKVERSLYERERQYRTLVEQIPAIVYVDDVKDGIQTIYIGPQIEKILGYTPREWLQKSPSIWDACVHPDDRESINSKFTRCATVGEPFEAEYRMQSADGRLVWVHDQAVLLRDEYGNPQLIHGVMQDITEGKRAEEALRSAEEKYRHIFENTMEAITQTTPEGRYITANPSAARIIGYDSPEEMIASRTDLDREFYVKPGRREEFKKLMEERGSITNFESEVYRKDGGTIWILENSRAVCDEHGDLLYYEGTAQDITERKQAEERLEQFFSINLDLLCIADLDGNFIKVNKAWESILGYSTLELEHRKFLEFVHPDDMDSTLEAMTALGKQERVLDFVNRYRCMDGSYRFIEWRSQPSGNLIYAAARDITERKQAEEALRESEEKMRSIFRVAPVGIGVIRDQKFYEINPRVSEITGYSVEELVGQSAQRLHISPDEFERVVREQLDQIARQEEAVVETRWRKKDGSVIDVLLSSTLIDPDDFSKGATFTVLDITERKRAEEALKESEAIFSSFLEHSPVYVFFKDKNIRSLMLSKNYEQMLGLPINELLGKTMDDLFPSDLAKSMVADDLRILNEGRRITIVEELNGRVYETTKFPVFKDGEPYILAGFTLDITERKQAEEALKRQNKYLLALQETALELVSQLDLDVLLENIVKRAGKIIGADSGFLDMVDVETNQLLPRIGLGALAESLEHPAQFGEGVAGTVWQTGQPLIVNDYDSWPGRIGSYTRQVLSSIVGIPLISSGKVLGVLGVGHEYATQLTIAPESVEILTQFSRLATIAIENARLFATAQQEIKDRKQAEEALRESEELYRRMNQNSPIGMHFYSLDEYDQLIFAGANPAADMLLETDNSQFVGKSIDEAFPLLMETEVPQRYRDAAAGGIPWSTEQISYTDRQIIGAFEVKAFQTTPRNMVAMFADITARKKAEEALRESEALYRKAIEVSSAVPYRQSYHANGVAVSYDFIGEGIRQITGYGPEEFDEPLWDSLTEERILLEELAEYPFDEAVERVRSGLNPVWKCEHRIRARDGSIHWVFEAAVELRDQNGVSHGSIGLFQDITARKQAEEKILNLNAELEQRVRERTAQLETTNKELEAFSYSVSHDLRAPLRGIDGWSQALLEDYSDQLDEQGRQYIERVRSETQRMGRLIDDMLRLSRLTRAEMSRQEVDLSDLARTIAEQLKQNAPHRQMEFRIESGLTAEGDANLLEAVLSNLLGNAFKFTGKRADALIEFGQIELEGRRVFFVRDNGAGFDMAYAQKLFGAFQRMHKSSEFPGTGVGLAIVQRIVHRHGGRLWAEAEPGRGAVFYFTLG